MTTIIIKNSSTSSAVPVSGDLTKGELAVNVTDKKLYTKDNGGSVVKLVGGLGNQEASAVAITGGAIDGTPIGATTASTASFTTLSASGNVTLSGGTANGVLYLNGSKVATSGSALTFDGTNLNVGIGGAGKIQIGTSSSGTFQTALYASNGVDTDFQIRFKTGITEFGTGTSTPLAFSYGGSEAMRLTSTGLKVGSTTDLGVSDKLTVVGGNVAVQRTAGITTILGDNTQRGYVGTISNHTLSFLTNSVERMYLDTSGNLGLGVTPSSQQASYRAIDISSSNSANYWALAGHGSAACEGNLLWNAYTTGNETFAYKYTGDAAARFRQSSYFAWFTAPSGTAGNAITFTQAMTLDASGRLGVGVTSPSAPIELVSNSSADGVRIRGRSADNYSLIEFATNAGTVNSYIGSPDSIALTFYTNGFNERARIDSSGNLLIGGTSVTNTAKVESFFDGSTTNGFISNDTASAASAVYFGCSLNGTLIGSVQRVGSTSAVVYNTTSDARLKSNIENAAPVLDKLMQVKVRQYDWTDGDLHQDYGFIAQELEPLLSGIVAKGKTEEDAWQLDYSRLTPHLVKAIQELKAEFDAYKASHP